MFDSLHCFCRSRHSAEYCAMYDICGESSAGKVLNCPYGSPSIKPDDLLSSKIQSLCPAISGNAIPLLVSCPACLRNFLNLFCELSCSPNQSLFINVSSIAEVDGNMTVDGIDYYVSEEFGEGLYNACKDVKFGSMNTRAIDFVGGGAKNYKEWFAFLGQKVTSDLPGSPYAMNFRTSAPASSGMKIMDVSPYSCNDTSLGCSCGDCPLSPVCSSSEPPHSKTKDSCSFRLGSIEIKCVDLSMAILFILLVGAILGWGFFYKTAERSGPPSIRKPLLSQVDSIDDEIDGNISSKVAESAPLAQSAIQGFMADIFRRYGRWVARNPIIVLCSSVGVVIILCIGLVRFKVETRPEKVCCCMMIFLGYKFEEHVFCWH
ncbi:hypothetical protein KSS87_017380 [Heliosperma pusillum]|nr:hypothetical protein KSS87_017380 [Heliosperma pusillum]